MSDEKQVAQAGITVLEYMKDIGGELNWTTEDLLNCITTLHLAVFRAVPREEAMVDIITFNKGAELFLAGELDGKQEDGVERPTCCREKAPGPDEG